MFIELKFSKQQLAVAVHTLLKKQKKLEARVNQLGNEISTQGVNLGEVVNSDLKMLVDSTGLRLKTFFKRSKVFQLILACFDALNPNILSIFFGQIMFLRYV